MKLIEPKFVYKNVQTSDFVVDKLIEHGFKRLVLVVDKQLNSRISIELTEKIKSEMEVVNFELYSGTEPQTDDLDCFLEKILKLDFDAILGIGGGSTMDFVKAASVLFGKSGQFNSSIFQGINFDVDSKKTCVCIPSTAGSGAEATKSAVMFNSKTNVKRGINNLEVLPNIVFLIPDILNGIPPKVFYPSLFDGLTHAFESLIGNSSTKQTSKLAIQSLQIYGEQIRNENKELFIHNKILDASYLAGVAICNSETGPIHALSYPLSEFLGLSHGQSISLILPKILLLYSRVDEHLMLPLLRVLEFDNVNSLVARINNLNNEFVFKNFSFVTEYDLEKLVKRSMELKGAIKNSPILWNEDLSFEIYNDILNSSAVKLA
jgi:alcohol dehydrogenase class IV